MKKYKIIGMILIIFVIVLVGIYVKKDEKQQESKGNTQTNIAEETQKAQKRTIVEQLTNSGEIKAGQIEQLKLNTNRKFKKVCVSQDEIVKKGNPLVEYTNGTYLYAPYDLVVTNFSVPTKSNEYCTELNYIEIQNIEKFNIEMEVKESQIGKLAIGQQVKIEVNALENKIFEGKVSHISQVGKYENKKSVFKVLIEFQNNEQRQVKIGMSAYCTIIIKEAKDVITIPIQSVKSLNDEKYVMVKTETGEIKKQVIETGISDSNYVEVKSGLSEGENVIIPKTNSVNEKNEMQGTFIIGGQ